MKIISFAYTTGPLLAGAKTVTRRNWKDSYARTFHAGDLVAAFDRSPRFGGKQVATLRLLQDPYLEIMAKMPDADFQAEGFAWLQVHPEQWPKSLFGRPVDAHSFSFDGFRRWRQSGLLMWVVRFELVEVVSTKDILLR